MCRRLAARTTPKRILYNFDEIYAEKRWFKTAGLFPEGLDQRIVPQSNPGSRTFKRNTNHIRNTMGGGTDEPLPRDGGTEDLHGEVVPKMARRRAHAGQSRRRLDPADDFSRKNSPSVLSCIGKRTREGCDHGSCTNVSQPHRGGAVAAPLSSGGPKWWKHSRRVRPSGNPKSTTTPSRQPLKNLATETSDIKFIDSLRFRYQYQNGGGASPRN